MKTHSPHIDVALVHVISEVRMEKNMTGYGRYPPITSIVI